MDAVLLHPFRFQVDLLHKKGHQRNVVLLCQSGIDPAERFRITPPVISGQTHLHQQRLGVRRLYVVDDFTQILLDSLRRKAAQAVITAQFD